MSMQGLGVGLSDRQGDSTSYLLLMQLLGVHSQQQGVLVHRGHQLSHGQAAAGHSANRHS